MSCNWRKIAGSLGLGVVLMALGFFFEPILPLGHWGWLAIGAVFLVISILILSERLTARIARSSAWVLLRPRLAVILHAKNSDEKDTAERDLGWEAGGLDDPSLDDRYEDQFRKEIGLPPRVGDDD